MASILDLLKTRSGENLVEKASTETSENRENISAVLGVGFPLLVGAMQNNVRDEEGAQKLVDALEEEKHGEDIIKNFSGKDPSELSSEGEKILGHIFGSNRSNISHTIAQTLNMGEESVEEILKISAPMLMGILGSQKKKENINSSNIGELLQSLMGNTGKFDSSLIETLLLGEEDDENVINNVKSMILGGGNKGHKDGGILGGMVGGK